MILVRLIREDIVVRNKGDWGGEHDHGEGDEIDDGDGDEGNDEEVDNDDDGDVKGDADNHDGF